MKRFFQILSFVFFTQVSFGQQPIVIVNEISTGFNGTEEYAELLVVGNCATNPTIDLRGWFIDDLNGSFYSQQASGVGQTAGCTRFKNVVEWSAIPVGSILLLYNDAAPLNLGNDPIDANGDSVYIIPISSTLLESSNSPALDFDYSTNPADYTDGGKWGFNNVPSLNDANDIFQLRSSANISANSRAEFAIAWGNDNQTGNEDVWLGSNLDGTNPVGFLSDSLIGLTIDASKWQLGSTETPGQANNAANQTWINNMRAFTRPNSTVSVTAENNKTSYCASNTEDSVVIEVGRTVSLEGSHIQYTLRYNSNSQVVSNTTELTSLNPQSGTSSDVLKFTVKPTVTTTYQIYAFNTNTSCANVLDDTITVTVNQGPSYSIKAVDTLCVFNTKNLNTDQLPGASVGLSHVWSPSSSLLVAADSTMVSPKIGPLVTTTYTLVVTDDATGCSNTLTTEVRVENPPKINLNTSNLCIPANLNNVVSDDNVGAITDFTFFTDAGYSIPVADPTNVTVDQIYYVRATNSFGCITDSSFTISQTPELSVNRQGNEIYCKPKEVSLDTVVSDLNGGAVSEIGWFQNNTHTIAQVLPLISDNDTIYFKKEVGGCIDTDSIILTFTELDDATFTVAPFCEGSTPTFPLKSNPFMLGSFTADGGLVVNSASGQAAQGSGAGTYNIFFTSAGNCPNTESSALIINPLPSTSFNVDCSGSKFNGFGVLAPTASASYQWFVEGLNFPIQSSGSVLLKNNIVTILPAGVTDPIYYVQGIDTITGCNDTSRKAYSTLTYPDISVNDTAICRGLAFNLDSLTTFENSPNTGGSNSSISFHYGFTTDPDRKQFGAGYLFNVNQSTIVYALKTIGTCTNVVPVQIAAKSLPIPNFSYDPALPSFPSTQTVQFTDKSTNATQFSWKVTGVTTTFSDSSTSSFPSFSFPDSGNYIVKLIVTDTSNSCMDSTEKQIKVAGDLNIFIPKAFSPNFDGLNEKIGPYITSNDISEFSFEVYNSWGGLIYKSIDIADSVWDGTYRGTPSPKGTYVYNIEFTHFKKIVNQKGFIHLVR